MRNTSVQRPRSTKHQLLGVAVVLTMIAVLLGLASSPAAAEGTNDELTGSIWVSNSAVVEAKRLDLATGTWTDVSEFEAFPSRDGTEYVELVRDFNRIPDPDPFCDGFFIDTHKISLRSTATGKEKSSFEVNQSITGPVRISPDGEALLMWMSLPGEEDCVGDGADYRLTVLSRSGEILGQANNTIFSFDWAPNNKVMIIKSDLDDFKMALMDRETFTSQTLLVLPPEMEGTPDSLRVTNDGFDAFFESVTDTSSFLNPFSFREATVWHVDFTDTPGDVSSEMVTAVRGPGEGDPRVNSPVPSPDGKWLLISENHSRGKQSDYTTYPASVAVKPATLDVIYGSPTSYALDIAAEPYTLPLQNFSKKARPVLEQRTAGVQPIVFSAFDDVFWTPAAKSAKCGGKTVTIAWGPGATATAGDDVIMGTGGPDVINGLGGNDVICGGGGKDRLAGGGGNDRLFGDRGNDRLLGGAGKDRLYGGNGNDKMAGGPGNDLLSGQKGKDTLKGNPGKDNLLGGSGKDSCNGHGGKDKAKSCETKKNIP